jgi:hypothetical protein
LSWNPTTRELEKIDDQWADNLTMIERSGAVLGEQLSDGLSAWKRQVRRPGCERLLQRAASGESDGIVVWHTDRLFRQPRDLERLIDLGDRGFRVSSAHGSATWPIPTTASFCGSRSRTPRGPPTTRHGVSSAGSKRCASTDRSWVAPERSGSPAW